MRRLGTFCLFLCFCLMFAAPAMGQEVLLPSEEGLAQMRRMNPDFSTFPEAKGIIWQKEVSFAQVEGGVEVIHLWVILGREGLESRWLEWTLPSPKGGRVEVIEAGLHVFETGVKLADADILQADGTTTVRFIPGVEPFLLVLAWREFHPDRLILEGFAWTQEELPLWEVIVQARLPQGEDLAFRAFPQVMRPAVEDEGQERVYTWRRVNVDPRSESDLAMTDRAGVAFTSHGGAEELDRIIRDAGYTAITAENSRKVLARKASENRLSAIMDLRLDPQGILSGRVRVLLRGDWGPFLLGGTWPAGEALNGLVDALFPGLQNYETPRLRRVGGVPELSFALTGKPGVGGSGSGLLAIPPLFEPRAFRALDAAAPPFVLRFPFILEQNLNITLPPASRALVSGAVGRSKDAINYSESYKTKKRTLTAEARCALGAAKISEEDAGRLRRCAEQWRNFSTRPLPVQLRAK